MKTLSLISICFSIVFFALIISLLFWPSVSMCVAVLVCAMIGAIWNMISTIIWWKRDFEISQELKWSGIKISWK